MEIIGGVLAVHFRDELADEGLLVESRVVGAQEVVPDAVDAVVVHLESIVRAGYIGC